MMQYLHRPWASQSHREHDTQRPRRPPQAGTVSYPRLTAGLSPLAAAWLLLVSLPASRANEAA